MCHWRRDRDCGRLFRPYLIHNAQSCQGRTAPTVFQVCCSSFRSLNFFLQFDWNSCQCDHRNCQCDHCYCHCDQYWCQWIIVIVTVITAVITAVVSVIIVVVSVITAVVSVITVVVSVIIVVVSVITVVVVCLIINIVVQVPLLHAVCGDIAADVYKTGRTQQTPAQVDPRGVPPERHYGKPVQFLCDHERLTA